MDPQDPQDVLAGPSGYLLMAGICPCFIRHMCMCGHCVDACQSFGIKVDVESSGWGGMTDGCAVLDVCTHF